LVIFEIQQNSDTTYRVFDWNRLVLDGKPRELHIPQSLASIDFEDYEPSLVPPAVAAHGECRVRSLVRHAVFTVEVQEASRGVCVPLAPHKMQIVAVLEGRMHVGDGAEMLTLAAGEFCLVPANLALVRLRTEAQVTFLRVEV